METSWAPSGLTINSIFALVSTNHLFSESFTTFGGEGGIGLNCIPAWVSIASDWFNLDLRRSDFTNDLYVTGFTPKDIFWKSPRYRDIDTGSASTLKSSAAWRDATKDDDFLGLYDASGSAPHG